MHSTDSVLAIVTATTNKARAQWCVDSWVAHATGDCTLLIVENGGATDYLGTVRAFRQGVEEALAIPEVSVVACLHDDVEIFERGWDELVTTAFRRHPKVGLLGFGGAIGLGADDLYQTPYDPMQLARIGFRSNLVDAELHGSRSLLSEHVVCLDGFSQIGRRAFWEGRPPDEDGAPQPAPWTFLDDAGFVHHFYDGALGCLARRLGWQVQYLPVRCRHYGGQTAVGDAGYQAWAATQIDGGDRGFWERAHELGYRLFTDVLPLRL